LVCLEEIVPADGSLEAGTIFACQARAAQVTAGPQSTNSISLAMVIIRTGQTFSYNQALVIVTESGNCCSLILD
jgi:hypothetical protein